jgi:hypothetical protein
MLLLGLRSRLRDSTQILKSGLEVFDFEALGEDDIAQLSNHSLGVDNPGGQ